MSGSHYHGSDWETREQPDRGKSRRDDRPASRSLWYRVFTSWGDGFIRTTTVPEDQAVKLEPQSQTAGCRAQAPARWLGCFTRPYGRAMQNDIRSFGRYAQFLESHPPSCTTFRPEQVYLSDGQRCARQELQNPASAEASVNGT